MVLDFDKYLPHPLRLSKHSRQNMKHRPIVIMLVYFRSKILVHLRDEKTSVFPNHYAFLSGSSEQRELPARAAKRELYEETNFVGNLTLVRRRRRCRKFPPVSIYTLELPPNRFHQIQCHEGQGVGLTHVRHLKKSKQLFIPGLGVAKIAKPKPLFQYLFRILRTKK